MDKGTKARSRALLPNGHNHYKSKAQRQAHSDAHIDTHIHSHIHTHSVVKLKKQFNFIATQIDTKKKLKRWKPGKRVEMEVSNCEYFDYIWFDLIRFDCTVTIERQMWVDCVKRWWGRKLWEIMGRVRTGEGNEPGIAGKKSFHLTAEGSRRLL